MLEETVCDRVVLRPFQTAAPLGQS